MTRCWNERSPMFSKNCPKITKTQQFYLKLDVFKMPKRWPNIWAILHKKLLPTPFKMPKNGQIFGLVCTINCSQPHFKIAQSSRSEGTSRLYNRTCILSLIFFFFFFFKMGQSRPLFVYFRSFHIPIQMTNIQFEQYKLKKA